MASFYKRGTNWTASVSIKVDGLFKKKTKSGFKTKREATNWAIEMENKKINDTLSKRDGIIAEMFDEWYAIFKEPLLETQTKGWYRLVSKILRKEWSDRKLSEINSSDFQKMVNEYGKNHVRSSVAHVKNILSSFIKYAVDEDFINKDFSRNIKVFSSKSSKDKDLKFLENDELEMLIKEIENSDAVTSHMILLAIYSGARYSEVAALTRNDFNFKNNTISINKSWQANDQNFKATKTKTSNRIIDLPPDFVKSVRKWTFGKTYAFESITGLPPTNAAVNKQVRRYLKKNDSKLITFHGLRHTHASFLLSQDIAIQYVSERLGHADVNITLSTYAHLLDKKRTLETNKTLKALSNL